MKNLSAGQDVNVTGEKIIRDHSDHLYPVFNTHIPHGPGTRVSQAYR